MNYTEFDGGHAPPPQIARDALGWFLGSDVGTGQRIEKPGDEAC